MSAFSNHSIMFTVAKHIGVRHSKIEIKFIKMFKYSIKCTLLYLTPMSHYLIKRNEIITINYNVNITMNYQIAWLIFTDFCI